MNKEKIYEVDVKRTLDENNAGMWKVLDPNKYEDGFNILAVYGQRYFKVLKYQSFKLAVFATLLNADNLQFVVDDLKDNVMDYICKKKYIEKKEPYNSIRIRVLYKYLTPKLKNKYRNYIDNFIDFAIWSDVTLSREEFRKCVNAAEVYDYTLYNDLDFELNEEDIDLINEKNIILEPDTIRISENVPNNKLIEFTRIQLDFSAYNISDIYISSENFYELVKSRNLFNKFNIHYKFKLIKQNGRFLLQLDTINIESPTTMMKQIIEEIEQNGDDGISIVLSLINAGKLDKFINHDIILKLLDCTSIYRLDPDLIKKYVPEIVRVQLKSNGKEVWMLPKENEKLYTCEYYGAFSCSFRALVDRIKYYDVNSNRITINDVGNEYKVIKELEEIFGGNENDK